MRFPLEVGRAGLGLMTFIFVLAAMILYFGRPSPGSGPFVITVIMLVGAAVLTTLLMIIMRKSRGDESRHARTPEERNNHD